MGADVVFGFECDCAAAFGMAFGSAGAQTVLHDVRGGVHGEFVFVRAGAEPGSAGALPDFAGRGRRRIAAERAGDSERHVFAREAWHGVCSVRTCGGCCANDRAVAGRMDYGQFFMEMDFLHQRAGGNYFADPDEFLDQRSAVHEEGKFEERDSGSTTSGSD